jgi:hypothetical protein
VPHIPILGVEIPDDTCIAVLSPREVNWNTILSMIRREFENPVEQVMFILGFKHDPRFRTALDAMRAGSNPGIVNALDQLAVYGAIDANFCSWRQMMKTIHEQVGSDLPLSLREEFYEVIVSEMDEKNYGGKWFPTAEGLPEHWISVGAYSPVFRRGGTEVFCLPAPYFSLLSEVFE